MRRSNGTDIPANPRGKCNMRQCNATECCYTGLRKHNLQTRLVCHNGLHVPNANNLFESLVGPSNTVNTRNIVHLTHIARAGPWFGYSQRSLESKCESSLKRFLISTQLIFGRMFDVGGATPWKYRSIAPLFDHLRNCRLLASCTTFAKIVSTVLISNY